MKSLLLLPMLAVIIGMNYAYAEPLENIQTSVLSFNGTAASIQVTWNQDVTATQYEIGCVSCVPNSSETTVENNVTINGVTPFPGSTNALLYVMSYNAENEIIDAKQIFLNLEESE